VSSVLHDARFRISEVPLRLGIRAVIFSAA
jgi:hypothetical protein